MEDNTVSKNELDTVFKKAINDALVRAGLCALIVFTISIHWYEIAILLSTMMGLNSFVYSISFAHQRLKFLSSYPKDKDKDKAA